MCTSVCFQSIGTFDKSSLVKIDWNWLLGAIAFPLGSDSDWLPISKVETPESSCAKLTHTSIKN